MQNTFVFRYVIRCTSVNGSHIRSSGSRTRSWVTWLCQCSSGWRRCDLCSLKLLEHLVFSESSS